jgi:Ca2+:H+ antiporter
MCFFAGGTRFSEQGFGMSSCSSHVFGAVVLKPMTGAAQLNSSLLTLSVIAVLLPAAFHSAVQPTNGVDPLTDAQEGHDVLAISHGASGFFFVWLSQLTTI